MREYNIADLFADSVRSYRLMLRRRSAGMRELKADLFADSVRSYRLMFCRRSAGMRDIS